MRLRSCIVEEPISFTSWKLYLARKRKWNKINIIKNRTRKWNRS